MSAALAGSERSASARSSERQLLVLAVLIVFGAYLLLGLSQAPRIAAGTFVFGGALAILAAVAHASVRRFAPDADALLLPAAFLVNGVGLVIVRRIDFARGTDLAVAQTTWTVVGVGLFALTLLTVTDHRRLTRFSYTFGLATIALLLLPLLPVIGREVGGARLWIRVGPLNFQPGEIAKLTLVVFLAGYLEQKRALLSVATQRVGPLLLPPPRHLAPVVAAAGTALGILVFQRDLGSSLLLLGVFVVLLYTATGRLAYPAIGLSVFAGGAGIAYLMFGHVRTRFNIWLDPWADVTGEGFQIAQSLFALGTGGLTGAGLGLGRPHNIPAAATDAIFAVLGEELGLLGGAAILLTFLLIVAKGFKTALTATDEVGTLLATGLTTILALQTFLIIGGITRLIPLTGIALPFLSYGGSALVGNYILLALLVRISDDARGSAYATRRDSP